MDMDERRREGRRGAKRIGRTGLEGKEGEERGEEVRRKVRRWKGWLAVKKTLAHVASTCASHYSCYSHFHAHL